MKRIQDVMLGMFLGILVAAAIYAYKTLKPSLPSVLATPAKELAKEKPTTLACKPVVVYRDKIKEKLGLPEPIKTDATKHVVNSTQVKASDRPTTITAVYDDQTGAVDLFKRRDPLPWIGLDRRWSLGAAYGLRDDAATPIVRVNGSYELLQVKAVHFGVVGHLDTDGRRFGGVGFWFSGR